jgi:hypothetical protein
MKGVAAYLTRVFLDGKANCSWWYVVKQRPNWSASIQQRQPSVRDKSFKIPQHFASAILTKLSSKRSVHSCLDFRVERNLRKPLTQRLDGPQNYAEELKAAGSIPDKVIAILNWLIAYCRNMTLEFTQPLTELCTRNPSGGTGRSTLKAHKLTAIWEVVVMRIWKP